MPDNNQLRRLRSLLFAPGDSEKKLLRALGEPVNAVIADLEDAVAMEQKAEARAVVASVFSRPGGGPARLVRVNRSGTGLLEEDIAAIAGLELDGIVVPKAEPGMVIPPLSVPIVAIIETAAGAAGAREVAAMPGVEVLMLGSIDLALELRLGSRRDEAELAFFRSSLVLESAVAGLRAPIDGVFVDVRDPAGLRASADLARAFGMGGKAGIHPSQVAEINAAFAASADEVDQARRIVEAYEEAAAAGRGVVALDGRMIDQPVVEQARRLLADESTDAGGRQ